MLIEGKLNRFEEVDVGDDDDDAAADDDSLLPNDGHVIAAI